MVSDYVALLRPRYHFLFLSVIIAALGFGTFPLPTILLRLAVTYITFCIFLYGGLYTINGIGDRKDDAAHPTKKHRPVASGRISVRAAWIYALTLITLALLSAYALFSTFTLCLYIAFIVINLLYTYVLKHIPYIELVTNSLTHPLRAVLGAEIARGFLPLSVLAGVFLLALSGATFRRVTEKERHEESGRPTLRAYTNHTFLVINIAIAIGLAVLCILDTAYIGWHVAFLITHCLVAFARPHVQAVKKALEWPMRT